MGADISKLREILELDPSAEIIEVIIKVRRTEEIKISGEAQGEGEPEEPPREEPQERKPGKKRGRKKGSGKIHDQASMSKKYSTGDADIKIMRVQLGIWKKHGLLTADELMAREAWGRGKSIDYEQREQVLEIFNRVKKRLKKNPRVKEFDD